MMSKLRVDVLEVYDALKSMQKDGTIGPCKHMKGHRCHSCHIDRLVEALIRIDDAVCDLEAGGKK